MPISPHAGAFVIKISQNAKNTLQIQKFLLYCAIETDGLTLGPVGSVFSLQKRTDYDGGGIVTAIAP